MKKETKFIYLLFVLFLFIIGFLTFNLKSLKIDDIDIKEKLIVKLNVEKKIGKGTIGTEQIDGIYILDFNNIAKYNGNNTIFINLNHLYDGNNINYNNYPNKYISLDNKFELKKINLEPKIELWKKLYIMDIKKNKGLYIDLRDINGKSLYIEKIEGYILEK